MPPCYDPLRPRWRHPLRGSVVLAVSVAAVVGAATARWSISVLVAALLSLVVCCIDRDARRWMLLVVLVAGVGAAARSQVELRHLAPRDLGAHQGWVRVIDDPRPGARAVRSIVEVEGQRFEVWARGEHRTAVSSWRAGDLVALAGERRPLTPVRAARVAWQHVVGHYRIAPNHDLPPPMTGSALARSTNSVRAALERGAAVLPDEHAALFRGLVVGDRRDQPQATVERFRTTGLSHLMVVSGLNVSLLLVAAGPGLRRMRPTARWMVTVGLVAWFVALTRFEPSILRAGAMAAISATAYATGRDRAPARILCLAVTALVLVDPLLVRSVGFWLSVGATAGVCTVGPWLAGRLSCLGILAAPVGITLGAQVGVAVPLMATFGAMPVVSVPANLLAVPVASVVKLYGLPAGLLAGWVPGIAPVLMAPVRVGVWWVDGVARVAQRAEPSGGWVVVGWLVVLASTAMVLAASAAKNQDHDDGAPADR